MQQKLGSQKRAKKTRWSKLIYPNLAERLFFELDPNSWDTKRRYSYRDIAKLMQERYQAKIHYSTIYRWAHKFGWLELWDNAVREGMLIALKTLFEDAEYQKFTQELADDIQEIQC
jgi:hypothetical protein